MTGRRDDRYAAAVPVAFAIGPVLSLWAQNAAELRPAVLAAPAAGAVAASLALYAAARRASGSAARAAVLTSLIIAGAWSYGAVQDALAAVLSPAAVRHRVLLPAYVLVWAAALWWAARRPSAPRATGGFAVAGAALMLGAVAPLATRSAARTATSPYPAPTLRVGRVRPDIYLIVLDSYPAARTLRELYGRDDASFERALAARGLRVAPEARANYGYTLGSVPATLNMAYWHGGPVRLDRDLRLGIGESAVVRALGAIGYRFVDLSRLAEAFAVDFPDVLAERSVLRPVWHRLALLLQSRRVAAHRRAIEGPLDTLALIARDPRPTFTYVHVMAAHAPFVYSADGGPPAVPVAQQALGLTPRVHRELLTAQLRWLDGRVLAAIDAIDRASPERAAIVIQADHGPASLNVSLTPTPEALRERFRILSAARLPGVEPPPAPPTTPVNTFRILLDAYFDARLPLLPDRSWFEDWQHGRAFADVTPVVAAHGGGE